MILVRLLLLPWWATPTRARWWIGGVLALIVLFFLGALGFAQASLQHNAFGVLITFNLVVWVALLPNAMVLARDARALRLPALERDAVLCLLVHALLLVVVPAFLIKVAGLSAVQTLLAIGICAALAMAYACLPAYFSIAIVFVFLLTKSSTHVFVAEVPHTAFTLWAGLVLLVLLLALAWGWRRALRGGYAANSMHAPMIFKFRMNAWKSLQAGNSERLRQRADWMRPQADLRRCGPAHRPLSLRVALGGLFLPQHWGSRLRNWTWIALWSSWVVLILCLQAWAQHPQHLGAMLRRIGLLAMLGWGVGFGATMVAVIGLLRLGRMWQNVNAELPLLALLPAMNRRGDLLQAMLLPMLRAQGLLLALSLVCVFALHLHPEALAFIVLAQCGAIAYFVAFALLIAGGRLPSRWIVFALAIVAFALINVSLFVPTLGDASMIGLPQGSLAEWLTGTWMALGLVLAWLGHRGWVGLRERPHPYLPSSL